MPLLEREIARRAEGAVELRQSPLRARWELGDLLTSDGHRLRCVFSCSVRALDRAADRQMLVEALLDGREAVTADDVIAHFTPALRAAVARQAPTCDVEGWLADHGRQSMLQALRSAGQAVAFTCGLELLSPFDLEKESPTLERQRLEALERQLAERQAAGQVEHLQRAAELLKQFRSVREVAPELSPGQLLARLSIPERGPMLQALLMASAKDAEVPPLWVISGTSLLRLDTSHTDAPPEVIQLPQSLGPLRSVRGGVLHDRHILLIGGRSGVMVVDPISVTEPLCYIDRELHSAMGFNSGVVWRGSLWASHTDAGLVKWRVDNADEPAARFASSSTGGPAGGARNLMMVRDRLLYSRGRTLFIRNPDGREESLGVASSDIVSLLPYGAGYIAVMADGEVAIASDDLMHPERRERRCGGATAAALLPWLGDTRLLLATLDGVICCVGLDDPLVTQYASAHREIKALTASASCIAAVSGDRQRLVLWQAWDGRKPAREIHIAAMTRHRIADVVFA